MHPLIKLGTQQHKILQFLASATGWSSRQDMYEFVGREKGYSKALGERTGSQHPHSLVARAWVEQAPFDGFPLLYRITQRGRDELSAIESTGSAPRSNHARVNERLVPHHTPANLESMGRTSSHRSLNELDKDIRLLTNTSHSSRPFLCDGSPFGCHIAEVGINPGSAVPFWPYWSPSAGCNKAGWFAEHRRRYGRRKATRERLERFIAAVAPYRVLELNMYDEYSPQLKDLATDKRSTRVFDHMLKVAPTKILLVHGDDPRIHLEHLLNQSKPLPSDRFVRVKYCGSDFLIYAAAQHFRNATYAYVETIAARCKERLVHIAA